MKSSKSALWSRKDSVLQSKIDDEVVLLSIENNRYYTLDPIASSIWQLLESPLTLSKLCDALTEEFEVDRATCEAETLEFLEVMKSKNLVESVEQAPS